MVTQYNLSQIVPKYLLCLKADIPLLPPIVPPLTPFPALPTGDNERQKRYVYSSVNCLIISYNWTYYRKNNWMRLPPNLNMYLNSKFKSGCDNFVMQTDHAIYDVNLSMMRMYRRPSGEMSLIRKESLHSRS